MQKACPKHQNSNKIIQYFTNIPTLLEHQKQSHRSYLTLYTPTLQIKDVSSTQHESHMITFKIKNPKLVSGLRTD